jgi:hypothetical protein
MKYLLIVFSLFSALNVNAQRNPPPGLAPVQLKARIIPPPAIRTPARPTSFNSSAIKGVHVRLLNGDIFRGEFMGFNEKGELVWRHPAIEPEMRVNPSQLAKLTLTPSETEKKPHNGLVRLINGDSLVGDFHSLGEDKLVLNTWYGNKITLNRSSVQTLVPGQISTEALYVGPSSKDINEWKHTNSSTYKWTFRNDGFQSNGTSANVGRLFPEMPASSKIEFDYQWSSGSPSIYVSVLTDNLASYSSGNCYSIRISSTSMYIYRYSKVDGRLSSSRLTPSTVTHRFNRARLKSRVTVCVNPAKKTLAILVDGRMAGSFKDNSGRPTDLLGKGIAFHSRSSIPSRISNITISKWDGALPNATANANTTTKDDFVMFNNEDSISGRLLEITEGTMKFKTEFAELPIPLNTVSHIHMAKEGLRNPVISSKSIRATLIDDIRITGEIRSWENGEVVIKSPVFGEATFKANAFKTIEFNLGKPRSTASNALKAVPTRNSTPVPQIEILRQRMQEQRVRPIPKR